MCLPHNKWTLTTHLLWVSFFFFFWEGYVVIHKVIPFHVQFCTISYQFHPNFLTHAVPIPCTVMSTFNTHRTRNDIMSQKYHSRNTISCVNFLPMSCGVGSCSHIIFKISNLYALCTLYRYKTPPTHMHLLC